ncbi:DUF625-domain-containing protein [Anaeromyces robustus]|uniref:DUF625-domain-containing protein n=1 Tax=Anaeromyces robustus TaxID=1754192 RepID=A0A1Y1XAZ5_9FUNG|nr:DUF625-domain-containing protein [Anaeromyces robustus]|eukprot:ORX82606.1 DUF625-domain-containing protein [Anaeromyces robustus]
MASSSITIPKRRVKVYELSDDGSWMDRGTGHILPLMQTNDIPALVVISEENQQQILYSRIYKEYIFRRQQETLILWTDQKNIELALSFQESTGCYEVWNEIAAIQKDLPPSGNIANDDYYDSDFISLPEPTIANLEEIENTINQASRSIFSKDHLAQYVISEHYIDKLIPLLEDCEDLDSTEDLYRLSAIMKAIIYLNDNIIYHHILQDDIILGVVGMLERDRDFPNAKASYREYLSDKTRFKHVVSFNNPEIEAKIHQTYRAQYLKDVVLARTIDDPNYSSLNSIIFFNYVAIVNFIQTDKQFLKNLFDILNDKTNSIDKRKQVIMFLHELCSVTKGLQYVYRDIFYKSLTEYGLLSIVEELAYHDDISIRLALISMLTNMLDHETALVRNYCINQMKKDGKPLIESIIDRFHSDPDSGIRSQYMDILRILLDTSTLDPNESITTTIPNKPEVDEFLDLFYEKYINLLVKPITDLTEKDLKINKRGKSELYASYNKNSTFFMICELLCFCIKNHSYRCKFFILKSTITEKICLLLKSNEKYIRLSALRYFRACISMKDEFYNKHLIKNSVFKPIIQMLVETEKRNNLLNSACLELFVFVRMENIKSLIIHIVSNYREILETFDYVNVFKLLIARYEQYQDSSESQNNNDTTSKLTMSSTKVNDWGKADEEEEAYFNDDDDDEEDTILENNIEKITEDSNKNDKSERNINPRISISNSVNGPSRGRIANPNAIVARFIRSTQPLASGLVDYPDDDDIIEEEEDETIPKPNMKPTLNNKNDNKVNEDNNNNNNNGSTVSSIGKYSLSNGNIRKIEFVSEKDKNKNENENENKEKKKENEKDENNDKEKKEKENSIINTNDINKNINKEINTSNDSLDKSNNKNNKRSREEEEINDDDEPLPIRKKVNKEDDDEIFLKSINRNKLKKEANKLNPNEKSPLNSKKITLNISPKLKHTEITSTLSSTTSPSSSPSSNPTSTSPQKKIDSNAMDEDEKEPNTTIISPIINNNNSEEGKTSSTQDNKKKVDIIINPNLKNLKKS